MSYFFMIFIADIPVVEPLNPISKIVYFYTMRIELVLKRSLFFLIIEKCGNDIVCFSFVHRMRIITIIRDHFDKWRKKKIYTYIKKKKNKKRKEKETKRNDNRTKSIFLWSKCKNYSYEAVPNILLKERKNKKRKWKKRKKREEKKRYTKPRNNTYTCITPTGKRV